MFFFQTCVKSLTFFQQSIGQEALISGTSDVIVAKYPNGEYKSTPFMVCFGSHAILYRQTPIKIKVNNKNTILTQNKVNRHGYMKKIRLSQKEIESMNLKFGKNLIKYILNQKQIQAHLYLLDINHKLLISDVDGTLTKNDFGGLLGGILQYDYLHDGYANLLRELQKRGVIIVWITMRSLPLYACSKQYITKHTKVEGPLIMEPEQFLPAIKKQIFKKTGNIKANLIKKIRNIFPKHCDPFIGGLGNREGDAIAYLHAGMKLQSIYLVGTSSKVQKMSSRKYGLTYQQMSQNIDKFFDLKEEQQKKQTITSVSKKINLHFI